MALTPAYAAWYAERGVKLHPSLRLAHSPAAGYHVVAAADVPAGELLLSVPLAATLDLDHGGERVHALVQAGAPPLCASALLLADALAAGGAGPLGAHTTVLESLPPIGNLLEWDVAPGTGLHAQLLRGTSLAGQLHTMPLAARWREVVAPYLAADAGRAARDFPAFTSRYGGDAAAGERAFLRAATLVMSRCFHANDSSSDGGGGHQRGGAGAAPPRFVPVADFFNHHPTRAVTQNARVGDAFCFYALRPVAGGGEVFLTYGDLSDGQLLHTYGFVPQEEEASSSSRSSRSSAAGQQHQQLSQPWNPHNSVTLPASAVTATLRALVAGGGRDRAGKAFDKVLATLRSTGLLPSAAAAAQGDGGFTLQMTDDAIARGGWEALQVLSGDGGAAVAAASAPSSSSSGGGSSSSSSAAAAAVPPQPLTRGQALEALLPPALLTAVQLLASGDASAAAEYASAVKEAGRLLGLPVPAPSTLLARLTSAGDGEDGDDAEPDDVLETWAHTLAVLAAALRGYPTGLKQDAAWLAAVRERMAAGGVGSDDDSASTSESGGARKRQRTAEAASSSSADGGDDNAASGTDPWAWPLERQVAAGATDGVYRSCRLLAMREKEQLAAVIAAVDAELRAVQETGDEDDDEEGSDDEGGGAGLDDDDDE